MCQLLLLMITLKHFQPGNIDWSKVFANLAMQSCPLGDHQEVPDPMPSAWGRSLEWNPQQVAKQHIVPSEHHRRGLQRGCLHTKILCLQLSGEALKHPELDFFFLTSCFWGTVLNVLFWFLDRLCRSHLDLRLRVPPCHSAHVRGAQRVSVRSRFAKTQLWIYL